MPRVMSLHQIAVKSIVIVLCSKSEMDINTFFDSLPLPLTVQRKLKNSCTDNILSDVIYWIVACNVWLEVKNNYHEENVRLYRTTLENIINGLLPFVLKVHGI